MRAAVDVNISGIEAECGGCCSCATCHVYLDQASALLVAPALADEVAMLEFVAAERLPSSRLSCQIDLTDAMEGLMATVAPTQV